jgi:iron complex outermembrane recepter protein
LNVPSTDNFYDAANTLRNTRPDPETSKSYEVGYRLNKGRFIGSLVAHYTKFENQIQTVFDPVEQIGVSRNIGGVENYGLEAQLGANITDEFQVVVSGSFLDTKLLDDRQLSATTVLFTRGLERTDTARYTFKARADYTTELFELGVQGIYTGERFTTDINDRKVPGTFVVDLNASINLDKIMGLKNSQIQFNVQNLFDEEGFGGIGISNNANTIPAQTVRGITSAQIAGNAANAGFRFLSPRVFQVSVQVGF